MPASRSSSYSSYSSYSSSRSRSRSPRRGARRERDRRDAAPRRRRDSRSRSRSRERERKQPPALLRVRGLSRNVSDAHLREIFGAYGLVRVAKVAIEPSVNLSKGYAQVEYVSRELAVAAAQSLDGSHIDGMRVQVVLADVEDAAAAPPVPVVAASRLAGAVAALEGSIAELIHTITFEQEGARSGRGVLGASRCVPGRLDARRFGVVARRRRRPRTPPWWPPHRAPTQGGREVSSHSRHGS